MHLVIAKQADYKKIKGTGRRELILKEDVLRFLKLIPEASEVAPIEGKDIKRTEQTQNVSKAQAEDKQPQGSKASPQPKQVKKEAGGKEPYQDLEVEKEKLLRINAISKSKLSTPHSYISAISEVDSVLELINEKSIIPN